MYNLNLQLFAEQVYRLARSEENSGCEVSESSLRQVVDPLARETRQLGGRERCRVLSEKLKLTFPHYYINVCVVSRAQLEVWRDENFVRVYSVHMLYILFGVYY